MWKDLTAEQRTKLILIFCGISAPLDTAAVLLFMERIEVLIPLVAVGIPALAAGITWVVASRLFKR